eukprot:TRINITY_DN1445_c0_g1_i1.p1 TRINITY_DN1445_c0_g1~~TRINITY_DN1445_c0_g1_i1.p1  ORF type:complete len:1016 (+),score=198.55 TRINITY_DN1445_c0_g1_i1:118-3048(+)
MPVSESLVAQLDAAGLSHVTPQLAGVGVDDVDTLALYSVDELRAEGVAASFGEGKKLLLLACGAQIQLPAPATVEDFLHRVDAGLGQYAAICQQEGVDTLQVLSVCSEEELTQVLGITSSGLRRKLMTRLVGGSPVASPSLPTTAASPTSRSPPCSPADRTVGSRGTAGVHPVSALSSDGPALPTRRSQPGLGSTTAEEEDQSLMSTLNSACGQTLRVGHSPSPAAAPASVGPVSTPSAPAQPTSKPSSPEGAARSSGGRRSGGKRATAQQSTSPKSAQSSTPMPSVAPDKRAALHSQRPLKVPTARRSTTPVGNDSALSSTVLSHTVTDHSRNVFQRDFCRDGRAVEKRKLVNVFENGRYCDAGGSRGLWTPCVLPRVADMQVLFQVLTRSLGWHRRKDDIYRQTDTSAGGREITKLWAFNGRPLLSPEDVEDGMWIVAGTGHQAFISPCGSETSWTKKDVSVRSDGTVSPQNSREKHAAAQLSIFDRLSDPSNFTGSQGRVHSSQPTRERAPVTRIVAAKSGGVKGRQLDKKAAALQRAQEVKAAAAAAAVASADGSPPAQPSPARAVGAMSGPGTVPVAGSPPPSSGTLPMRSSPPPAGTLPMRPSPRAAEAAPRPETAATWDPRQQAVSMPAVVEETTWDPRSTTAPQQPPPAQAAAPEATWDPRGEAAPPVPVQNQSVLDGMSPRERIAQLEASNKLELHGWKKLELLGKGSFGMVYRGELQNGTQTAVKLVQVPNTDASGELALLVSEISFMVDFDHERIVKCFGCLYDSASNEVQIFLELMPGGSVASLVAKNGCLPVSECRKYTRQLLEGLVYLHSRGVIHRDVKGDNLLLDADGNAHIADFGTSKQMMDSLCSMAGGCATMVGTPYWMAPEVIMANPDDKDAFYGMKADVWSVGCTLVEMITGKPPWAGQYENMWSAIFHIAQSKDPPPTPDDIPAGAKSLLRKAFRRNHRERPSAADLLKEPWLAQ